MDTGVLYLGESCFHGYLNGTFGLGPGGETYCTPRHSQVWCYRVSLFPPWLCEKWFQLCFVKLRLCHGGLLPGAVPDLQRSNRLLVLMSQDCLASIWDQISDSLQLIRLDEDLFILSRCGESRKVRMVKEKLQLQQKGAHSHQQVSIKTFSMEHWM